MQMCQPLGFIVIKRGEGAVSAFQAYSTSVLWQICWKMHSVEQSGGAANINNNA